MAKQKMNPVELKMAGRTVILKYTENDESKSINFTTLDKNVRDSIKEMAIAYNKFPSKTKLDKIIKIMTPVKEKKATLAIVEKKVSKRAIKVIKEETKQLSEVSAKLEEAIKTIEDLKSTNKTLTEQLAAVPKAIEKTEVVSTTTSAVVTSKPRGGEY